MDTVCYQDSRGLGSTLGTVKKKQETEVFELYSIKLKLTLLKHLQAPKSPRCPLAIVQTPAVSEELRAGCSRREWQSGAFPWLETHNTQDTKGLQWFTASSLTPSAMLRFSKWSSLGLNLSLSACRNVYKTLSVWSRKCLTQPKMVPDIPDLPSSTESSPHPWGQDSAWPGSTKSSWRGPWGGDFCCGTYQGTLEVWTLWVLLLSIPGFIIGTTPLLSALSVHATASEVITALFHT